MEPCGSRKSHASHHYIASDSNGYWCEGFAVTDIDLDAIRARGRNAIPGFLHDPSDPLPSPITNAHDEHLRAGMDRRDLLAYVETEPDRTRAAVVAALRDIAGWTGALPDRHREAIGRHADAIENGGDW
jgi:hypothetical protein